MANINNSSPGAAGPAVDAMHQIKNLLSKDPAFAQALRAAASSDLASKLAAERGIVITPEALWRNRGTIASGGLPTWRG